MSEVDLLNSRFKLHDYPIAPPGKCAVCGAVDRPVIDFDMTIQFYGAVFICVLCMGEAARRINMVPAADLEVAKEGLTQSFNEQLMSRDLVALSNDRYRNLLVAIGRVSDSVLLADSSYNVVVESETGATELEILGDDSETESRDDGVTEQEHDSVVSKRSDSVPTDSSNGTDIFDF